MNNISYEREVSYSYKETNVLSPSALEAFDSVLTDKKYLLNLSIALRLCPFGSGVSVLSVKNTQYTTSTQHLESSRTTLSASSKAQGYSNRPEKNITKLGFPTGLILNQSGWAGLGIFFWQESTCLHLQRWTLH